jgi:uncharacterized SAM-binding protein YcdF (DUF218 family)
MSGRGAARRLRLYAALLAALGLAWFGGLVWFARGIPDAVSDPDTPTDAIVVLTGGSLRIQKGLTLLAEGKAKKLFVSGVHPGTDVTALLRAEHLAGSKLACCIVLGHEADNTLGNARETALWVQQEGFHSLRLVTSSYHMPRALLEFSRAMPETLIIANPVFPERVRPQHWWARPGTAMLVAAEYQKYLLALARPLLPLPHDGGSVPS